MQTIAAFLPIKTVPMVLNSGTHTTPYLTLKTVIFIWTSSPSILASLEHSNKKYTLPFVSSTSPLQTLLDRINVLRTYPSKYQANMLLPLSVQKTVLFLRLRFYNDDFGWMGIVKNTKGNCLGCVTDPSIHPGLRASPGGLANLPIFLTSTLTVKEFGLNKVLELYTDELKELSQGYEINVGQRSYLIFAYAYDFIGDEPARARALGLSPSVVTKLPLCNHYSTRMVGTTGS
ncbi:hypothetical protein HDU77_001596 [Chytriomyces hyalinus]|nr:hypothetical protein HDU77_001596 [Chytriomyces hyalinus]